MFNRFSQGSGSLETKNDAKDEASRPGQTISTAHRAGGEINPNDHIKGYSNQEVESSGQRNDIGRRTGSGTDFPVSQNPKKKQSKTKQSQKN